MAGGATLALSRTTEYDDLSGRQKAAILCMALGAETAAKITAQLTAEEAELISFEIARMDQVGGETAQAVLDEWLESILAADSLSAGGVEYARQILEKAFGPQKAGTILKRIQSQLAGSSNPALKSIASDLSALQTELGASTVNGSRVGAILTRLGPKVSRVARSQSGMLASTLRQIGSELTSSGRQLSGGGAARSGASTGTR